MDFMKSRILVLLPICLAIFSACGSQKVKGRPPFVSIASLSIQDQSQETRFDVYNINEVEMVIDSVEVTVRVGDSELASHKGPLKLSIDPNTTEDITVSQRPEEHARQMLAELETGVVASLPFSLKGRVHTRDDGYLEFEQEGHLYPVPGRPGQFRSASSRTRGQR